MGPEILFITKSPGSKGLFVFLILSFLVSGCVFNSSKVANSPVVKINDHVLSAKDLAEDLAKKLKSMDALAAKDPNNVARAKNETVRNFILESIALDYAKTNGIEVSDAELETEVNSIRSSYPDDISFRRTLAADNVSISEWKSSLKSHLTSKKVFNSFRQKVQKASPEEIKQYYETNKDRYRRKERIYLRQIVTDDLTKANALKDELGRKGDFSTLAKKYSVAPEGKNGGLVGWIERGAVDIFDKAFSLTIGTVGPVLESPYGFHIFKVERRAPEGVLPFDEIRPQAELAVQAQKEQAEFLGWLDQQIRTVKVFKNIDLINSISVETRGQK